MAAHDGGDSLWCHFRVLERALHRLLRIPSSAFPSEIEPDEGSRVAAQLVAMGTLGRVVYSLGKAARSTGQALDRLGSVLQGGHTFKDEGKSAFGDELRFAWGMGCCEMPFDSNACC